MDVYQDRIANKFEGGNNQARLGLPGVAAASVLWLELF